MPRGISGRGSQDGAAHHEENTMAEIVKYLDPEAVGNGDGNSWTNAYVSIAAVEAANAQLSGSGDWWHVYFRSLGGTADTTQVNWDGWTTSLTEYVLFEGISGQRAVASGWQTGRYRWSVTNPTNTMALILSDNYIYFDGMQMEMLSNHSGDSLIYHANNPGLRLTNCRLRVGGTAGTGITVWVYQSQGASCEAKVWNTIIEKHPSHNASDVARGWYGQLGSGDLYNCVVYGFNRGVLSNDANTDTYDSAVFNNDDDFYHVTNPGTIDYCASDDNDGTNNVAEGTTGGAAWPNIFEDAANGDFRPKAGVALIGAGGMAGAGLFSTDIEGTTRGAAWDVGAFEYVAAGSAIVKIINE
jgi:hypothetical protein